MITGVANLTIKLLRYVWRGHYSFGRMRRLIVNVSRERSLGVVLHPVMFSEVMTISHLGVILLWRLIVPETLTVAFRDWVLRKMRVRLIVHSGQVVNEVHS